MKVLYIAAECKPFSKAGGVGDVTGELPAVLKQQGIDIEIVTPWYGLTSCKDARPADGWICKFNGVDERVDLAVTELHGVAVTFLKNRTYFETDYSKGDQKPPFASPHLFKKDYSKIYVNSEPTLPFVDDAARFSFFSEACLGLIQRRRPDIVHVNDWVLGYLLGRMAMTGMPQKKVLTIHNIGYQGNLGSDLITGWQIEALAKESALGTLFADPRPEWKSVNALRLGMEIADAVNTVSPTYKVEMTMPEDQGRYFEGGKGLDKVAARLDARGKLHGILNGFEYRFEPDDQQFSRVLDDKARTKAKLSCAFPSQDALLFGFVGRAVEQKFKLLSERVDGKSVLEHILDIPGVNVAVVAAGQPEYEAFLSGLRNRENLDATLAFDRAKAQEISLGSDVFLMPSLFEPCGITQMESLSYATPPLVRWTGGLVDTVKPHTDSVSGTGFGFDGATRREVLENLIAVTKDAVRMHSQSPLSFQQMQRRGFQERFLWQDAAKAYVSKVYEPVLTAD